MQDFAHSQASMWLTSLMEVLLLLGTAVQGLPPGQRDPQLAIAASPETAIYFEWAGRAGAKGDETGVEAFPLDPELISLRAKLCELTDEACSPLEPVDGSREISPAIRELADLLWNKPASLQLNLAAASTQNKPKPDSANTPAAPQNAETRAEGTDTSSSLRMQWVLTLGVGAEADACLARLQPVLRRLDVWRETQPSVARDHLPRVALSTGRYLIISNSADFAAAATVGLTRKQGGLAAVPEFARQQATLAPAGQAKTERVANLLMIQAKSLQLQASAALDQGGREWLAAANVLGLKNIESLMTVQVVSRGEAVLRASLNWDGPPAGFGKLLDGPPLSEHILNAIPAGARSAQAISIDLEQLRSMVQEIVSQSSPENVEPLRELESQLERELGLSLVQQVWPVYGPTWCTYHNGQNGGTSKTSQIGLVEIRNAASAREGVAQVVRLAEGLVAEGHSSSEDDEEDDEGFRSLPVVVSHEKFLDRTIYYFSMSDFNSTLTSILQLEYDTIGEWLMWSTPAICATENSLILGVSPQVVRSHLRQARQRQPQGPAASADGWGTELLTRSGKRGMPLAAFQFETAELWNGILENGPWMSRRLGGWMVKAGLEPDSGLLPSGQCLLEACPRCDGQLWRTTTGLYAEVRTPLPILLRQVWTVLPRMFDGVDHSDE